MSKRNAQDGAKSPPSGVLDAYLEATREQVLAEIDAIVPADGRWTGGLYALMRDYPLRGGKALRPALCMAACRAAGGSLSLSLRPAAVLELYHNAFLIHDDVEDGSELRRDEPTLHAAHGSPIAINVGDGLLALCSEVLLDGVGELGLGRTLRIYRLIARMARETAEGQMIELDWVRRGEVHVDDRAYCRMVYKKTAWYSFVAPLLVGAEAASRRDLVPALHRFGTLLGIAFQIRDDLLNLTGAATGAGGYGKEWAGDLWEGKHTLMLTIALRRATDGDRTRALAILRKSRHGTADAPELARRLSSAVRGDVVDVTAVTALAAELEAGRRSEEDVAFLAELIERHDGVPYADAVARRYAARARSVLARCFEARDASTHRAFLEALVDYVIERDR